MKLEETNVNKHSPQHLTNDYTELWLFRQTDLINPLKITLTQVNKKSQNSEVSSEREKKNKKKIKNWQHLLADASCVLFVHLPWLIMFFDPVLISKQSDYVCVCTWVYESSLISIRLFMVGGEGVA